MNAGVQTILAELRLRFEAIYGKRLVKLVLFGSQARDDTEPGSDIDVLVVLSGSVSPSEEIERTINDVAEISLDRDVVVSCVFMDEERFTTRNGPLLRNVRKEGIPV